ncbi:gem (nuclear organelle) associated protein 8, partial [Branchiostoma belcheri]
DMLRWNHVELGPIITGGADTSGTEVTPETEVNPETEVTPGAEVTSEAGEVLQLREILPQTQMQSSVEDGLNVIRNTERGIRERMFQSRVIQTLWTAQEKQGAATSPKFLRSSADKLGLPRYGRSTTEAPAQQPGQQRKAEMKLLYGARAAVIHGLETAMQMEFDASCDLRQPKLWPTIPLKL